MELSFHARRFTCFIRFLAFFSASGSRVRVFWAWVVSSGTKRNEMPGNAFEQPWQQDLFDAFWCRGNQTLVHVFQFFQRSLETQPQRIIDTMLYGRIDNQPPNQQIQEHMPGDFVIDGLRRATPDTPLHALGDSQFAKRRLDFPAAMIQPDSQTFVARFGLAGQTHPILARSRLGAEHVRDDGTRTEARYFVLDEAQLDLLGQAAVAPARTSGHIPFDQPIPVSQAFDSLQADLLRQTNCEKGVLLLDLMKQPIAPEAPIEQHQVVQ